MANIELLKKAHLEMSDSRRAEYKNAVSELYRRYAADNRDVESKWLFNSGFLSYIVDNTPTEIYDGEIFVGTGWAWKWQRLIKDEEAPCNCGHFIPDWKALLELGVSGKITEVTAASLEDDQKRGMLTALEALKRYITKYASAAQTAADAATDEGKMRLSRIAQDCAHLSSNPPETFRQALQLILFANIFLTLEAGFAGISLGKIDSYLFPYYSRDIESGALTYDHARELLECFYIKLSEASDSCMLTVGGNFENELTELVLEAQTLLNIARPSISLRVSEATSEKVLEKAARLAENGSGMPAFLNDRVLIDGFKNLGVTDTLALENYGNVGCYEAVPEGYHSNTVACGFNLYDSFSDFLESDFQAESFEAFFEGYKSYFAQYYKDTILPSFKPAADFDLTNASPFERCLRSGRFDDYFCGINILGIGILTDSLYVIKKLVYEEGSLTLEGLKQAAEDNFADADVYSKIKALDEHYGSNNAESNALAREISDFIGKTIVENQIADNVIASPGLFMWGADIRNQGYKATLNGRRRGELLSYGIMPAATPRREGLTSILMSCANISAQYFPNGCPVMVTLNKVDFKKTGVLGGLLRSFFSAGGSHLAVNVSDGEMMKKARINPTEYSDMLIKISGHSACFVSLDAEMQDALIKRSEIY